MSAVGGANNQSIYTELFENIIKHNPEVWFSSGNELLDTKK
jgi:hypothetical protein